MSFPIQKGPSSNFLYFKMPNNWKCHQESKNGPTNYLSRLLEYSSHWCQLGTNGSPEHIRMVLHARKRSLDKSWLRCIKRGINHRHLWWEFQMRWRNHPRVKDLHVQAQSNILQGQDNTHTRLTRLHTQANFQLADP